MNEIIKTKFGNARINNDGYYQIHTKKEGNYGKLLHRLIWEDWYQKPIPEGYDIHHINMLKTDNKIQNLQCVEHSVHVKFHKKKISEETRKKISESRKGKKLSKEHCINISKTHNSSGYYRVDKVKDKRLKQGFYWRYRYYDENGKQKKISSVDLDKLKEKVLAQGLPWYKIKGGG